MQWKSVIWILIMYAIIAPSLSTSTREKRSIAHIKRFLLSNFLGSNRRKHTETSLRDKPSKNSKIFVVPDRHNLIIEAAPKISVFTETEATRIHGQSLFSNALRQFLDSTIFQKASKALRGLISLLQTEMAIAEETNSLIDDISKQVDKYASDNTVIIKQNMIRDGEVLKRPIFSYGKQRIISNPQPVFSLWGPIVSMPRRYTYEQIKDGTVEKFTLDKNSDVIVTHTRGPMLPRPACIDDRIKEVIQSVPSSAKSTEFVFSNIINQAHKSPVFVSIPKSNKIMGNGIFFNSTNVNGTLSSMENIHKTLLQSSVLTNYVNSAGKIPLSYSESKFTHYGPANKGPAQDVILSRTFENVGDKNEKLQGHIDQLRDLRRPKNSNQFEIQNQSDVKQLSISDKNHNKATVENANLQTQYTYKQETNDGVFKYSDKSNVSIVRDGEKFVLKMLPTNNTSVYAGDPIVVLPTDDTSKVFINTLNLPSHDNDVSNNLSLNVKEMQRGDIPEHWYSHY